MNRLLLLFLLVAPARADEATRAALAKPLLSPRQAMLDVQDHAEARLPRLPALTDAAAWSKYASKLRADILANVVLKGKARAWAASKLNVIYGETIKGDGYSIRKLRYEAVPGLWIPALLYTPAKLPATAPVMLAVNGHDRSGKAAGYKQTRCINLCKRGMIVLNNEWFGMGQLRTPTNQHTVMNQIDLCGTPGVSPFFLSMKRGLDVLLSQPRADPTRVAVSGLSGGGWQTIWISSLDERVTLANPVAGYSPFRVKIRDWYKDLGDSEQTPTDFGRYAGYLHLTALRAPRPTLLTYNAKDNCCFEAGYTLPLLLATARPVYALLGKPAALRSHVNEVPGNHNYGKDNREALYRAIGDYFYPGDSKYHRAEIDVTRELRKSPELAVELPKDNASLNSLALGLAKSLPRKGTLPTDAARAKAWQAGKRKELAAVLRLPVLEARTAAVSGADGVRHLVLRLSGKWSVPAVEFTRGTPKKTALLLNDAGRAADAENVDRLIKEGYRVVAVDPWYFGENKVRTHDWLFALLMSCFGDRPLGLQAAQVGAVARWAKGQHGQPLHVVAVGPRTSLIALCAAAVEEKAISSLELHGCRATLKELIEENRTVIQAPEAMCFGLLEAVDVAQLTALAAPRPVRFIEVKERHQKELKPLAAWYALLGKPHDVLK